jgi:hypothetical protein
LFLLLNNAKLKILFYCHEAGKITYDSCKGRKNLFPTPRHAKKLRALRHSTESTHFRERISLRIRNHMQKYFNPVISDPSGIDS